MRKSILLFLLPFLFMQACQQESRQEKRSKSEAYSKAEQTLEKFYEYLIDAKMQKANEMLSLEGETFEMPGNAPVQSYEIIDKRVLSEEEAQIMEMRTDPQEGDVMLEVKQNYVGGNHHIYTYWLREIQGQYKIIDYESWLMEGYQQKLSLDTFVDEVERMVFKEGATQWYVESEITGFHVKDYMFTAKKGQKMTIKLNSDDPYTRFGLFIQRDKQSLNSLRIFAGKNEWNGKVPMDGDYRVRVYLKKKEAKKEHKANYSLFVEII
jgi:hypothetical protein